MIRGRRILAVVCMLAMGVHAAQAAKDLVIERQEDAIADRLQTQIEELLSGYFRRETFLITVKANLARIQPRRAAPASPQSGPVQPLPGLPFVTQPEPPKAAEPDPIELLPPEERVRLKNLEVTAYLDEKTFTDETAAFVRTVIRTRSGFDEQRGDILVVKRMPFPTPVPSSPVVTADTGRKGTEGLPLWYMLAGAGIVLLLFLMNFLMSYVTMQRVRSMARYMLPEATVNAQQPPSYRYDQPFRETETAAYAGPAARPAPELALPATEAPAEKRESFSEIRQSAITMLVGNPRIASDIFREWVRGGTEDGYRRLDAFFRASDRKLLDIVDDFLGSEIVSRIEMGLANPTESVDREQAEQVFREFRDEFQKEQLIRRHGDEADGVFSFLNDMTPEMLVQLLGEEPPGIQALALAQVSPGIANEVLKALPENVRIRIPVEMANLGRIPVSTYTEIANQLARKAAGIERVRYVKTDGMKALIAMLEHASPGSEKEILDRIAEHNVSLARELKRIYVTFEELPRVPDRLLAEVLRGIDREVIVKGLTGAAAEVKTKVLANIPGRLRMMVDDEVKVHEQGDDPAAGADATAARRVIMQRVRDQLQRLRTHAEGA